MQLKTQSRDPAATKKRILAAALHEFAKYGLAGARIDRIARRARSNKRMLYHYFGDKAALYARTLEDAYGAFRAAEAALHIEQDDPITALKRLVAFTWDYYLRHPEFISLVSIENMHKAKYLKASHNLDRINKPFVERMRKLLRRGVEAKVFRSDVDAVQMLITIAGVGYHYLTNRHTGRIVYGRDLVSEKALKERLQFNTQTILRTVLTAQALIERDGEI